MDNHVLCCYLSFAIGTLVSHVTGVRSSLALLKETAGAMMHAIDVRTTEIEDRQQKAAEAELEKWTSARVEDSYGKPMGWLYGLDIQLTAFGSRSCPRTPMKSKTIGHCSNHGHGKPEASGNELSDPHKVRIISRLRGSNIG